MARSPGKSPDACSCFSSSPFHAQRAAERRRVRWAVSSRYLSMDSPHHHQAASSPAAFCGVLHIPFSPPLLEPSPHRLTLHYHPPSPCLLQPPAAGDKQSRRTLPPWPRLSIAHRCELSLVAGGRRAWCFGRRARSNVGSNLTNTTYGQQTQPLTFASPFHFFFSCTRRKPVGHSLLFYQSVCTPRAFATYTSADSSSPRSAARILALPADFVKKADPPRSEAILNKYPQPTSLFTYRSSYYLLFEPHPFGISTRRK
ncbi:hypothetical protein EJ06DRAFT_112274 [Trichodelitschia bisporula]|uniref:Uncharacterized protein n=1 Tax=Trichodelitschia bisporula TaxID=703511 RepID=A0A6G1HR80_9PEZI|nr:hypothetical protein EJ06DRAFT_112274 [Trichodelitschia bisporula]